MVPVEQCLQGSLLVVTQCFAYQYPTSFARGAPFIMKATLAWYYVSHYCPCCGEIPERSDLKKEEFLLLYTLSGTF